MNWVVAHTMCDSADFWIGQIVISIGKLLSSKAATNAQGSGKLSLPLYRLRELEKLEVEGQVLYKQGRTRCPLYTNLHVTIVTTA
jgi:hypothetical protein